MSIDLKNLAEQIACLSGDDAATLLDAIASAQTRATAAREERVQAEAQRDARALTCGCGRPVATYRWLTVVEQCVSLGVHRRGGNEPLCGGYVADSDTYDEGERVPSQNPVFRTTWFKCLDHECEQWVEVPGENDIVIGCK